VRTIVDAGANVGTASVFLLNAYPNARVIALEPDAGNFEMLQRNLSYYRPRATALRQALWHRHERLAIDRGHFRDGGEWSIQVKQVKGDGTGAGEVEGVTLPELMRAHQLDTVDILKVDIEGAERVVFEDSVTGCLSRIGALAIELHDEECRRVFFKAIERVPGQISQHGEVTLWRRDR
jgi:FkbM family methyltransferase